MAAAATVTCPECHKTFKGRLELDGKKVRCPRCEHVFVVRLGEALKVDRGGAEEAIKAAPAKKASAAPPAVPVLPKAAKAAAGPAPAAPPPAPPPAGAVTTAPPPAPKAPLDDDDEDNPNPYSTTTPDLRARCPSCANPLESEDAVICLYCGYNTQTRAVGGTKKVIETTTQDRFSWLLPGLLSFGGAVVLVILSLFYCVTLPDMLGDSFFVHESLRMWVVISALGCIWPLGHFALKRLILSPTPPEISKD
jgi:predicted Zn finger-like uncharacterized protein